MAVERTFAIIKPDAVAKKVAGQIIARIEENGLTVVAMKKMQLSEQGAQGFYAVHKERPFFGELVTFMTSGPVVAMILEGEGAIKQWRDLMGPTNSIRRFRTVSAKHRLRNKNISFCAKHGC